MKPVCGVSLGPDLLAIVGDIHANSDLDVDLLSYYDGPLMWIHELPSGMMSIVSWVETTKDRLTDRYHIYGYQPYKFEAVKKSIIEDNKPLLEQFRKADYILVVDWRMRKDDHRVLSVHQCQWDQLDEQCLPAEDATLRPIDKEEQ